ncbi:putative RING-H2 finger protein ATL12 isoform X1 [Dendrobium catenatum]|uniref:RING-type E3 ubiquitin transferase n=1 Tax=Dendrobium catenatum TaxID=906689 RepID=A0A2I0W3Z5_9ASPA|nr:putative RING-H2 finger protein ATL12 isoform X1 [Dendrobium catenatum]PKU70373.1 Putative RING-H2 finger protein ATL12 [Dendrobium catenatum]
MTGPPLQILLLIAVAGAAAQLPSSPNADESGSSSGGNVQVTFRPSIAVVIGIFSIMFSLTFLLLMYGKFCHANGANLFTTTGIMISGNRIHRDDGRASGIDKAVIESLPFFRFSALKGSREGLECSVCLSRFDDAEILRLLPRCKHAFHMDCIDRWLEAHSSCPLCRTRVDVDDIAFFKYSASSRCLRDPTGLPAAEIVEEGSESGLELYVERERSPTGGPRPSFRWAERLKLAAFGKQAAPQHNFKHRILVSQVVFRGRWSDFNSADLISLDSEMLRVISSRRFEPAGSGRCVITEAISPEVAAEGVSRVKEEMERKRRLESKALQMQMPAEDCSSEFSALEMTALISPASRCMSDITAARSYRPSGSHGEKEEKLRQMWLPIARKTVQWFAGKEGRTMMRPEGGGDWEENV